ncbi:hypothetical protein BpHYR1_029151 [Brachionus plicatilis]|uniref:Uncharacterized protein n=1 Tax=Brachionus plicatilis TaxID=10195 RepID=A0A3M7PW28_BRAPC|nr:hypothetical protein BpHYR1_029151 [Brachionus plicatilis]
MDINLMNKTNASSIFQRGKKCLYSIFGLPTRCRTEDLQLALNINSVQNQITKQKLDFYERLCSNELTRKILQHSSSILEEVAIIIEEYSEYPFVSSQQLLQSRKMNLKDELFKWLRFDRDN